MRPGCSKRFKPRTTGRTRRFCSDACKQAVYRFEHPHPSKKPLEVIEFTAGNVPTLFDLGWAVALFEGEGSFVKRIKGNGRDGFSMTIAMCDESMIRRFHAIIVVGRVSGPFGPYNPNHQACWKWQAHGSVAKLLARQFYPYLSKKRRTRFDELDEQTDSPPFIHARDKSGRYV